MLVNRLRGVEIFAFVLLASCTQLTPPPTSSPLANDPVMFFEIHAFMASPVTRGTEHKFLFFFVDPDAIIVAVPSMEDTKGAHNQKSLFLSKIGELKCADRKNPPQLEGFTYYQECAKLVSRAGNNFVLDYTSHAVGHFPGGSEYSDRGRFAVQIANGICSGRLMNPERSYVNNPGIMVPLTVQSGQCYRVAPPD